jgi:hypothetical protein
MDDAILDFQEPTELRQQKEEMAIPSCIVH